MLKQTRSLQSVSRNFYHIHVDFFLIGIRSDTFEINYLEFLQCGTLRTLSRPLTTEKHGSPYVYYCRSQTRAKLLSHTEDLIKFRFADTEGRYSLHFCVQLNNRTLLLRHAVPRKWLLPENVWKHLNYYTVTYQIL